jgi:hypothetical protein
MALTSQNAELLRRIYGEEDSLEQTPSLLHFLDEKETLKNRNDMLSRNVDYLRHGWDECRQGRSDLRKRLARLETHIKLLQKQGVDIGELPEMAGIVDDEASLDISKFGEGEMHQGYASIQSCLQQSFFQLATIAQDDDDGDVQLEIPLEDGRVDVFRGPDEINSFFREMAAAGQEDEVGFFHGLEAVRRTTLTMHPPGLQFEETQLIMERHGRSDAQDSDFDEEINVEKDCQQQLSQTRFELDQAFHERDEARSQRDKVMYKRDLAILGQNQARAERDRVPSPDPEAFKTASASNDRILDNRCRQPEEFLVKIDKSGSRMIMTDLPTEDEQADHDATARELSLERELAVFRKESIETEKRMRSKEPDHEPHQNYSTSYQTSQNLPHGKILPNRLGIHTEIGLQYLLVQTQTERDLTLQQRDEARAERDQALRDLATRTAERNGARQRVQLLDDELREAHIREGGLREKLRLEQEAENPMVATLQGELNGLQHTFDDRLATALAEAERRRLLVVAESEHYFQQVEASNAAFLEAQTGLHEAQGKVQQLETALRIMRDERDTTSIGVNSNHSGGKDVLPDQLKGDLRDNLATELGTANEQIIVAETAIRNLDAAPSDVTNILRDLAAIRRELEAVQLTLQNITREDCKLESQSLEATASSGEVGQHSVVPSNNLTRVLAERDAALERIQYLEEHLRAASARADAAEAGTGVSRHIARNLTDQVNDLVQTRGCLRNEILRLGGRIIENGREQVQVEGGSWEEVPGSGLADQQNDAQQSTIGFPTNQPQGKKGAIDHSSGEESQSSSRASPVQITQVESSSQSPSPISEQRSVSAGHQAPGVPLPEPVQWRGSARAETNTRIWSGPRATRNPRPNYGVSSKRKASNSAKRVAKKKKI